MKDENNIHPDANTTNEPWASSEKGKAWAEKGQEVLPFSKTLLGGHWHPRDDDKESKDKPNKKKYKKCEQINILSSQNKIASNTIECIVKIHDKQLKTHLLLDSGALHGDYISKKISTWIKQQECKQCKGIEGKVRSAIGKEVTNIDEYCEFDLMFVNEINKMNETIKIEASILDINYPIIIGRESIKKYKMVEKTPSQFMMTKKTLNV